LNINAQFLPLGSSKLNQKSVFVGYCDSVSDGLTLKGFEWRCAMPKPKLKDIYGSVRPGPNSGQEKK